MNEPHGYSVSGEGSQEEVWENVDRLALGALRAAEAGDVRSAVEITGALVAQIGVAINRDRGRDGIESLIKYIQKVWTTKVVKPIFAMCEVMRNANPN